MDRCESGTYLLRNVPIEGKYMPTQASKKKKAATSAARLTVVVAVAAAVVVPLLATVHVAADMAMVATDSMTAVKYSVFTVAVFAN